MKGLFLFAITCAITLPVWADQALTSQAVGSVEVLEVSSARQSVGLEPTKKVDILAYSNGALLISAADVRGLVPSDKVAEFARSIRKARDWQAKAKSEGLAFEIRKDNR